MELVDLLLSILDSPYANYLTRQFVLTAITKIAARPTTSPTQQERIDNVLLLYTTSPELELQQRAVEFASLYNLDVRAGVLERMPPPELKATVMGVGMWTLQCCLSALLDILSVSENKPVGSVQPSKDVSKYPIFHVKRVLNTDFQGDLLGDDIPTGGSQPTNGSVPVTGQSNQDLLQEIFGSSSTSSAPSTASPAQSQKSTVQDILGLFDSPSVPSPVSAPQQSSLFPVSNGGQAISSAFTPPQTHTPPAQQQPSQPRLTAYPAYDKNELKITLTPQTSPTRPGVVNILARFQVTGATPATGLNFQAAVPKVC